MKNLIILLSILISTEAYSHQTSVGGILTFDTTFIRIDSMECEDTKTIEFLYTNTGNDSVSIHQVYANCGCTIPAYKNTAIAPGENGIIKVRFNSKDFKGEVDKWVIVLSDAPEVQLNFTTFVKTCSGIDSKIMSD